MPGPVEPRNDTEPTGADAAPVEIAVLTCTFDARPGAEEALLARALALRGADPAGAGVPQRRSCGIRHHGGRFLVIEKWESAAATVQAHLDSPLMTEMAQAAMQRGRDETRDRPLRRHLRLRPRAEGDLE